MLTKYIKLFFSLVIVGIGSASAQVDTVLQKIERLEGAAKTDYIVRNMAYLFDNHVEEATKWGAEAYKELGAAKLTSKEEMKFIFLLGSLYGTSGLDEPLNRLIDDLMGEPENDLSVGIAYLLKSYQLQQDDLDGAMEAATNAYDVFEEASNLQYLIRAGYSAASISYDKGDYDESMTWIDSTLEILQSIEEPRVEATCYMLKGTLFREKGQTDSVKHYLYKALEIENAAGNDKGIARVSNQIGIMEARRGNTEEAYLLFKKALVIHEKVNNTSSYIQMLNNVGIIHGMRGEYDSALSYYQEVLRISEETEDRANQALATGNIGSTLLNLSKHKEAISPLENSLELYREIGSKPGISRALNNLGNAHRRLEMYDEALSYLKQSLALKEEMGRKSLIAVNIHNIADLFRQTEQYDSASLYYSRALRIKKEVGDRESIALTYFGIGKLKRKMKEVRLAHLYVDSAFIVAREVGILFLIRDIREFQSGYYAELNDFEKAYEFHVLYKEVYDSLFTTESESVVAELQEKFRTKEQQQQIALLEQKRRNQNQLLAGLTGGAVLLVVLIVVIYNRYRLKNRSNKIIQKKSEELSQSNKELKELSEFKQGMTSMIAHDIKNPLNAIIGFSNLLQGKEGAEISKAGNAILRLVTNMLDVEKYETAMPSLNLELTALTDIIAEASLAVELLLHDKSIQLLTDIEEGVILKVDRELMNRVLVNLLSNAIKFSPHNGRIEIFSNLIDAEGKTFVRVSVSDQGLGIPEEDQPYIFEKFYQSTAKNSGRVPSTGLGLAFCKIAINAHDGVISAESKEGQGCMFHVTLEVEKLSGERTRTAKHQAAVSISDRDLEVLSKYSAKLKELKVHNVSAIMAILDEIEGLHLETKWPAQIRSAVQYSNKEQFYSLLEMIK